MADALVSFMLQKLDTVIQENIQQEVSLVKGVEEEVKKLTSTFKVIQAVLSDAEQRQIKDEAVKLWLEEFKDISYDMDDVLDEWSFEMHRSQTDNGEGNKKKVISSYLCSLCHCFNKVALRHNIGSKIKDIKERLDQAEMEKNKYRLVEIKSDEKPIPRLKTSSLVDVTSILGRLTDKEAIMSKLMFLGDCSTSIGTNQPETSSIQALHTLNIISIVGMGGLGKTTLAQLVFNDDQVKTHFEKTMWVCVSDPFDLITVTKAIIEEAKCVVPKSSEWNTLHHSLSESIKGKRFLLVLDDVWTEDRSIWEPLEDSFRYGAKGSRILVTTRNERVALMMNATYTHSLGVLSDNDCSLLLNRIALAGRNKENLKELKEIGGEISKKCKGLPLAAKTLGGLLHFKKNKKEWSSILESEIWKLEEVENGFLKPALLLSYYDLPLPLKGCFVYCSIFPKDHTLEKDFLVKLWMAQGFLKSTNGNEELEMIGDDYFNNLAMRSFFQDFDKDDNGNIISGKMHDLVHDLAEFLTKNECSMTQNNGTQLLNSSSRVRHLTLVCDWEEVGRPRDSYDHFISSVYKANKLRTLQIWEGHELNIKEVPANLFNHLRCLKVLCLERMGLESLANEIENLIHLRYLDLSNNYKLKTLPETISNLYNLQTLKLKCCKCLCKLPRKMRRLINLRHLDISETHQLSHIPQGIGSLTSLRSLSDFIVGGESEGCKIGELKDLNLLQGDLTIRGLGRVVMVNEAFEIQIKQKHIHILRLGFKPNEGTENVLEQNLENLLSKRMEDVLEVLEPHPDLVELRVADYLGFKLSRWIGSTSILSHMKILELYDCINLTKFPAFGQLPSLEVLHIKRATKVKYIGFEFYTNSLEHVSRVAFPKLKELYMVGMNNLEVWELEHGVVMPCLTHVQLWSCPKLKALPAFGQLPSLEVLDIKRAMKVKHIGFEFYTNSLEHVNRVSFPKLKELYMSEMNNLEVWELEHGVAMPCLRCINLEICPKLKALPALGKLPSLEELSIKEANKLMYIGCEFLYEVDEAGGERFNNIAFPKLNTLFISSEELEWEFGVSASTGEEIIIMPCLRELHIMGCKNLERPFVEILSKVSSLEILRIWGEASEFIKYIRHDDDDLHVARDIIIFPNLKELRLGFMEDMEELKIGFQVMPLLKTLRIFNSNKLKAIQGGLSKLDTLSLDGCASLYELPPFPNLKHLRLRDGPIHPSLPEAFATTLQALDVLTIYCWPTLTCMPEQIQQLTSLQSLLLRNCGEELKQRCRKDEGEDWKIISHIPNIYLF